MATLREAINAWKAYAADLKAQIQGQKPRGVLPVVLPFPFGSTPPP